jgi:predicted Rossmann fold flavoprotein
LLGAFQRFQARDTVEWFESRGVRLKTEADNRMFPVTDSSSTIIDCLTRSAEKAGVKLVSGRGVQRISKSGEGFTVELSGGDSVTCTRVMLATGGCRSPAAGGLAVELGHTLEPPVPSLFTFHVPVAWVRELAGITVESVEVSVPARRDRGALLCTHAGFSGPVILKVSAWGARELHAAGYQFPVRINWLPQHTPELLTAELEKRRKTQPARLLVNAPLPPLPARLWEALVLAAGISRETRAAELSRGARHQLIQQLLATELPVTGKTLNQEEFVTCGGVRLAEVNFKTMESKVCPGLYFGGELLDVDGITGGFNFQSAWTTGWLAGKAMANRERSETEAV